MNISEGSKYIVIGVLIGIAIGVILAGYSGDLFEGFQDQEYKTFHSEEQNFSFSYPADWIIGSERTPEGGIYIGIADENTNNSSVQVRIAAGKLGFSSLENIKAQMIKRVEGDNNLSLDKNESINVNGIPGLDFTVRDNTPQNEKIIRQLVFRENNFTFLMQANINQQDYQSFESEIQHIIDSLKFT